MAGKQNVQLFTFRTFPKALLDKYFYDMNVTVLGKLKEDIASVERSVDAKDETLLLGFALSSKTRQESIAHNSIHGKKIRKDGPISVSLITQQNWDIPVDNKGTHTFCNYAMYSLSLTLPVGFIHVAEHDLPKVSSIIHSLIDQ